MFNVCLKGKVTLYVYYNHVTTYKFILLMFSEKFSTYA